MERRDYKLAAPLEARDRRATGSWQEKISCIQNNCFIRITSYNVCYTKLLRAAYYTEPVLDSWGIKHYLVQNDAEAELIPLAYKEAFDKRKPVAVLIATEELDHRANAGN